MTSTAEERKQRIQLAAISEPGDPVTGHLVAAHGTEATIRLAQDEDISERTGLSRDVALAWQQRLAARIRADTVAGILDACRQYGITVTIPGDPEWPTGLDVLGVHAPLVLFQRGDSSLLARALDEKIAVTGARAATGYGEHITQETVTSLAEGGAIIVSGAAYGIDGAAHRAALTAGGTTIAVLAGGIDRPYPAGHSQLIQDIARQGAVVSENPPGTPPTRWRFLQRARILAATTALTVVAEAGYRSGALHVAEQARALGRRVAAFPGPTTSSVSAGPHRLIGEGVARLVTSADDIRELLNDPAVGSNDPAAGRSGPDRTPSDRRAELHDFTTGSRSTVQRHSPGLGR